MARLSQYSKYSASIPRTAPTAATHGAHIHQGIPLAEHLWELYVLHALVVYADDQSLALGE